MRLPSYPPGTLWIVTGDSAIATSTAAWVLTDHMNVEREVAWAGCFFLVDAYAMGDAGALSALESLGSDAGIGGVVVLRGPVPEWANLQVDGVVRVSGPRDRAIIERSPRGMSLGEAHELAKRIDWEITVRRAAGL